jgi:hypothetical protein
VFRPLIDLLQGLLQLTFHDLDKKAMPAAKRGELMGQLLAAIVILVLAKKVSPSLDLQGDKIRRAVLSGVQKLKVATKELPAVKKVDAAIAGLKIRVTEHLGQQAEKLQQAFQKAQHRLKSRLDSKTIHMSNTSRREVFDAVTLTRRGGILYSPAKLRQLSNYLKRRNIVLKVGDQFLPSNKAGGFIVNPDGTIELLLRSNPTEYEVWHELAHYIHWKKLGTDAYRDLPRKANGALQDIPEQFVFDLLENSKKRWNRLNTTERAHAIDYIYGRGGLR